MPPTVLKPSVALRRQKQGKLPHSIPGGHPKCLNCGKVQDSATEDPCFWENGTYCHCKACDAYTLHGAVYPPCEGYPEGIEIDTRGERRTYDLVGERKL